MNTELEILVAQANSGDKKALESVVIEIKDLVYNLSLKMLLFTEEAEDATQEIIIKIITHLSTFNHNSQFKTWVYRIATNYLLTYKSKTPRAFAMPFEDYAELIDSGQSDLVQYSKNNGELSLLEEEVKVSCTQGLLLCLNAVDRMVYILSEILEFNSLEGGKILEISSENFRKKLSRSRTKIRNFLSKKCGIANPNNPCRCNKKIDYLIEQEIINPKQLQFAHTSNRSIDLANQISDLEKSIAIYRSVPSFSSPENLLNKVKEIININ